MISVVTAYYNRKSLFIRTLDSFCSSIGKINFEVIAVDDGSDENERLEDLVDKYPFLKVIRLERENKWYSNSCIPFNIGFSHCIGDKVIIQNPECYHFGNILEHVDKNLKRNEYLSFGCYSLDKETTEKTIIENYNYISDEINSCKRSHRYDGDSGWYNHSIYRPSAFHFCSAIKYEDLMELGGFDERYALGNSFDDDEFLWRIRCKKMEVKIIDNFIVLHQNHYQKKLNEFGNDILNAQNLNDKYFRNKQLYNYITKGNNTFKANILFNKNQLFNDISKQENNNYFISNMNERISLILKSKWKSKIILFMLKALLLFPISKGNNNKYF